MMAAGNDGPGEHARMHTFLLKGISHSLLMIFLLFLTKCRVCAGDLGVEDGAKYGRRKKRPNRLEYATAGDGIEEGWGTDGSVGYTPSKCSVGTWSYEYVIWAFA